MDCDTLAATGANATTALILVLAVSCLALGTWVLMMVRRRGGRVGTAALLLMVLVGGFAVAATAPTPAQAAPGDCPPRPAAENSLTITQTSVLRGLAPGVLPVRITGSVVNNGTDDTFIKAIEVEISSVSQLPESPRGHCDKTDYVLRDRLMPVNEALAPGGSTTFTGAFIGFSNKSVNQDGCQRATVHLHYTAVPR